MNNDITVEREHLSDVLKKLEILSQQEEEKLRQLPQKYKSDPLLLQSLMSISCVRLQQLKKAPAKPYFSRIDFKESGKVDYKKIYIGKAGFYDNENNLHITDWRAPIAAIYYDGNLGEVSYTAPIGTVTGDLKLKRQIIIENGVLQDIFDVDTVSDDEILRPYLGTNADNRLKNIVSTIQREQNSIIRSILHKNVIVQGVAGSGKTTVALHRIAYLIYNHSNNLKPSQFMVIGPNKFFIKYISNVLPDLDAGNACQCTFTELAINFIGERFKVKEHSEGLLKLVKGEKVFKYPKYKMSIDYMRDLDKYLVEFENEIFPDDGIVVNGFQVFTKEQVLDVYNSLDMSNCISKRLDITILRLKAIIERDAEFYSRICNYYKKVTYGVSEEEEEKLFKQEADTKLQFKNYFSNSLKKVLSVKNIKTTILYKKFIINATKYITNDEVSEEIVDVAKSNVSAKLFDYEDLPALMYINLILHGQGDYKDFAHVVIDEAQDFGEFTFLVLKKLLSSSTFSIFGDLTQGIYSYRSISSWEQIRENIFQDKCEIMKLEKCYRTTIEIMLAANLVSKHLKLGEAIPVIRHGEPIKLTKISQGNKAEYILQKIEEATSKGMKSIAIICKNPNESKQLYDVLKFKNSTIDLITEDNEDYKGGICVLTSYLAKGLEFDSVIVYDVNELSYSSDNSTDMKLLYVAMTRALHELEMLYTNLPTKPLKELM